MTRRRATDGCAPTPHPECIPKPIDMWKIGDAVELDADGYVIRRLNRMTGEMVGAVPGTRLASDGGLQVPYSAEPAAKETP